MLATQHTMLATQHAQSLSDFRQKASETLHRINRTGHAEILTVNGEARAVLMAPAVYDELAREVELARDVAPIRKAMREFDEDKGIPIEEMHKQLRGELLEMKGARDAKNSMEISP
jgi:PHD/YefM family antitoxin component YafN of YafNO toxin-antitoxin module